MEENTRPDYNVSSDPPFSCFLLCPILEDFHDFLYFLEHQYTTAVDVTYKSDFQTDNDQRLLIETYGSSTRSLRVGDRERIT
jgi:hypothetical protein